MRRHELTMGLYVLKVVIDRAIRVGHLALEG